MKKSYRMEIVEEKEEGGFVVSYPDLPGYITCGETMESEKAWFGAVLEERIEFTL